MECYTYLQNIQDLLSDGKTSYEKRFGEAFKRQIIPFWLIDWVLPYFCERPVKNPSIWKESLTWIVPRIRLVHGGNLEGWLNSCRHWEVGNDGRIRNLLWKTQCTGSNIFQRKMENSFSSRRWTNQICWRRSSTLIREHPIQGEGHVDFVGESEGSLPPPQDSLPDAGEAINDFWSMSGNFRYRHYVEPRVKLHSEKRIILHSTKIHWCV